MENIQNNENSIEIERAVIRFAGDSGDGIQLSGAQFSQASVFMGNDISTFPDFPAEIRAPQGSISGVSGFQIQFGSSEVITPGDEADMLVALNPAALKANLLNIKPGGFIITNRDAYTSINLKKAGFVTNPLEDDTLKDFKVLASPISTQVKEALSELDLDLRSKDKCKNFFALGMIYYLYSRSPEETINWINQKFSKNTLLAKANTLALKAGMFHASNTETFISTYSVPQAKLPPGKYRQISGNTATAWGFMHAAQISGIKLFQGSYPITPASDILHELTKHKNQGVIAFQAEDEIASITAAIGASFAGALAITSTSGPGMALKTEALGLAISYETPLVVINVQRGGPSTGLPTKTEQSDLFQALYGRNGEAPVVVIAPSRPNDCFHMAYEAARLAMNFMTPVIFLSDGYIANGNEPWKLPDDLNSDYPSFFAGFATDKTMAEQSPDSFAFTRNPKTHARPWIIPGTSGLEYRIGGLEKDSKTGGVSSDPLNHQLMTQLRADKIRNIAHHIPLQPVDGAQSGETLVISWGGTYGSVTTAVTELRRQGREISHVHLKYLNPFPKNLGEIISNFKTIIVPELNLGQLKFVLQSQFGKEMMSYNKVQGQPFKVKELVDFIDKTISESGHE